MAVKRLLLLQGSTKKLQNHNANHICNTIQRFYGTFSRTTWKNRHQKRSNILSHVISTGLFSTIPGWAGTGNELAH